MVFIYWGCYCYVLGYLVVGLVLEVVLGLVVVVLIGVLGSSLFCSS